IENDCLIGMGAIVLSRARVGAGSLVGAGALVTEGQVIPPGSLALGAPARVLGPVQDAHRAAIAGGARHYAQLAPADVGKGFARAHPAADGPTGITPGSRGPMTYAEWGGVLGMLAAGPDWAAARLGEKPDRVAAHPGPDRWCALEVLAHLRDA